jgi:hypothetical protein
MGNSLIDDEKKDVIITKNHINKHPESLTFYQTFKIIEQMKFSICKIINGNSFGTGFICLITNNEKQYHLAALFTCNHVINNEDINLKKEIDFEFRDKKLKIKLDQPRIIYKSDKKEYDTTIIQLFFSEIDNSGLLEIDSDIFIEDDLNEKYKDKSVYIIHYPNGKETNYSLGTIKDINMNESKIFHYCSTEEGSSGAPILNLDTYKIIGIHCGKENLFNWNYGTLLKLPVRLFMDLFERKLDNKMKERLFKLGYLDYFLGHKFFHDKEVKLLDENYFINLYDNKKKKINEEKILIVKFDDKRCIITPSGLSTFFNIKTDKNIDNSVYFRIERKKEVSIINILIIYILL